MTDRFEDDIKEYYTVLHKQDNDFDIENVESVKLPHKIIKVPLIRQAHDFTCGVACTESIIRYMGYSFDAGEDRLIKKLKTSIISGTDNSYIAKFLNSITINDGEASPLKATPKANLSISELTEYLDNDQPVICIIQAWGGENKDWYTKNDNGHYVIAIGYDEQNIYFMDPLTSNAYTYISKEDFDIRWHDIDENELLVHYGIIIEYESSIKNETNVAYPLK